MSAPMRCFAYRSTSRSRGLGAAVKFPFKELPGGSRDYLRPAVPVIVEGMERAPQLCLLDNGALHNRFGAWVAEAAGIDLEGTPQESIATFAQKRDPEHQARARCITIG